MPLIAVDELRYGGEQPVTGEDAAQAEEREVELEPFRRHPPVRLEEAGAQDEPVDVRVRLGQLVDDPPVLGHQAWVRVHEGGRSGPFGQGPDVDDRRRAVGSRSGRVDFRWKPVDARRTGRCC